MIPVAANLINSLVGGTNGVLAYIHIPILDIVEIPWN